MPDYFHSSLYCNRTTKPTEVYYSPSQHWPHILMRNCIADPGVTLQARMGDTILCVKQKHSFENRQGEETANSTLYMKPVGSTLRNKFN